jgi:hypothetical protein
MQLSIVRGLAGIVQEGCSRWRKKWGFPSLALDDRGSVITSWVYVTQNFITTKITTFRFYIHGNLERVVIV